MPQDGFSMAQMPYSPWMSPQNLDPGMASALMRQNYAQALLGEGTQTSSVRSPWQAFARGVQGALGGYEMGQAQQGMQDYATGQREALGDIYRKMLLAQPQAVVGGQQQPQQQAPQAPPSGTPPGAPPNAPTTGKNAVLANIAQRESGGQNIFSKLVPQGTDPAQGGSGFYQIIPSTWKEGLQLAGIQNAPDLAINATPQQQYQVASALYDKYGDQPWAQSRPKGQAPIPPGGGGTGPTPQQTGGGAPPASGGGVQGQGTVAQTPQQTAAAYGGQMGRYYQGLATQASTSPYAAVRAMAPQLMQQALGFAQYGRFQVVGTNANGQPVMVDSLTGEQKVVGEPLQLHEGPFGQTTATGQMVIPNAPSVARGLAGQVGKGNPDIDNAYAQTYRQAWPSEQKQDNTGAWVTVPNANAPTDLPPPPGYPAPPGYKGPGGGAPTPSGGGAGAPSMAVPGTAPGAQPVSGNVKLANGLGVPLQSVNPYEGMDYKSQQTQRADDIKTANDTVVNPENAEARQAQDAINKINEFETLAHQASGFQLGSTLAARGTRGFAELLANNSDLQRMETISRELLPQLRAGTGVQRVAGPELQLLSGMGLDVHSSIDANDRTAAMLKGQLEVKMEHASFQAAYLRANGNLMGADDAWNSYYSANPVIKIDPDTGKPQFNTDRQDYRTWFRANTDPNTGQLKSEALSPYPTQPGAGATGGQQQPASAAADMPSPSAYKPGTVINNGQQRMITNGTAWVPYTGAVQ